MNAVSLASRAVLAQYATRVIRPLEFIVIGIFVLAVTGVIVLVTYVSAWWWLLMIVVVAYGIIGSIAWLVIHFTIDKLRPEQTKAQTDEVNRFIVKVEKVADTLQITRFGLMLRVIRDVMSRNRTNVLTEFTEDSKDLKDGFQRVISAFK
ncbi:MAG: hypothetical protein JWM00_116 [Candidatus Saccharibacteria bacterium]|nr:hypothetical protein [Candidatus Saccharibacteria bacterium]